ncbi:MAG: hypothetical protein QM756_09900 [Polyangiaceae bacterium]
MSLNKKPRYCAAFCFPDFAFLVRVQAGSVNKAVKRLTTGNTSSRTGKATIQDKSQALGQSCRKSLEKPVLRKMLMAETTQVMKMESSSGMTRLA